ncbi:MAG: sigma-54 dependent transcriptional regulator [Vicinamibacterales bacterium]|nr:sigma-54 dependent transcriptional regulator [Vicinamibacterales bacterium]
MSTSALALAYPEPLHPQPRLYIIDDDRNVLDVVGRFARPHGFDVLSFDNATDALLEVTRRPPDAALIDLRMPGMNGMDTLREIKRRAPFCEVVLMTGYGTIESAVEAVKLGATDYVRKPFDFTRLKDLLGLIRAESDRRQTVAALESDLLKQSQFHGMIGRSAPMLELFSLLRRIGPHFTTALITGETGVGKELVARALHATSKRRHKPFVTLNCSAIVETLFESELFGHARGAFTGAHETRAGLFEKANGGVIFLDEIGELPAPVQAKLLRVLEAGEMARVGSSDAQKVDVRVVAATNRVLEDEVEAGRFRSDLYYRLHVVELKVPSLRERRDDIPLIARAFLEENAREYAKPLRGLTPEAEHALLRHDWPGNVRELRNVLGRASMLAETEWIDAPDLLIGAPPGPRAVTIGPVRPMGEVEREQVVRALEETRGNKKEAARRLGISRRAFYRRLEKYGMHQPAIGDEPVAFDD